MKSIQEKYRELQTSHEDYKLYENTPLGHLPKEMFERIEKDHASICKEVETAKSEIVGDVPAGTVENAVNTPYEEMKSAVESFVESKDEQAE